MRECQLGKRPEEIGASSNILREAEWATDDEDYFAVDFADE